ncbi:voltage-gated chloride channel family protein [Paenibacillus sp. S150]|uniref:voltage-gated chloride channel family protein n=1 Tax=Paenibacillus sp. S150 TaxID=2749826 RepID=UPI001C55B7AE|nr:voltage-gated chloride channel family protein [Paenibacillus sp. S150]MBW4084406.1 voltage-gated chloride channel family protein [Paenibacillus sp. S150]
MKEVYAHWLKLTERSNHLALWSTFIKWILLGGIVGLLAGTASAVFLKSLDAVTGIRMNHAWMLYLLPLGGALISCLYMRYGKNSAKGNNLILEQIQQGNETIPLRMAPLVLFGTLVTHLFGGSAGREGTAVQMGGSLAEGLGRLLRINSRDRQILLMCGISGGFGSIFGTPLAGTLFGLEVVAIGLISHKALLPCFTASFVGDIAATRLWKVQHIHYQVDMFPALTIIVLLKVILASILFGLASILFSELTHYLKRSFTLLVKNPVLKSALGGFIIIALVYIAGSRDYLGLGLPLIRDSFQTDVAPFAFLWKLIFTSFTLGTGFQGGEVTPLFAIGATLGNSLAGILHLYAPFLASLGFIAVFCGATNTPIACFLMGIELFGSGGAVYMFIACLVSFLFSGHSGIYTSQQIGISKSEWIAIPEGARLSTVNELRKAETKTKTVR